MDAEGFVCMTLAFLFRPSHIMCSCLLRKPTTIKPKQNAHFADFVSTQTTVAESLAKSKKQCKYERSVYMIG